MALSSVRIILPNRRSVLKIKEDFVDISPNRSVILPQIISLGDLDEEMLDLDAAFSSAEVGEIKPALSSQKRLLLLARLISRAEKERSRPRSLDQSLRHDSQLA